MESPYNFEHLSTKAGFNNALSHFRSVTDIVENIEDGYNAADILNSLLDDKEMQQSQVLPTLFSLLFDKYDYKYDSYTMEVTLTDFSNILSELKKWKAIDVVLVYFHPDLGALPINPKNPEHFESLNGIKENELITIYVGSPANSVDEKICEKALSNLKKLLAGKKSKTPDILLKGKHRFKKYEPEEEEEEIEEEEEEMEEEAEEGQEEAAPVERPAVSETVPKKRRMTPFYSIPVTNELFHNGNVEAWKKIIQSYNAKHPNLEVYIYYDGERIHDIHSLFKWGKVKHGSAILIAIAGEDIQDVAKLQRYLRQGASPMFEAFLRFPVNTILNLF